MFLVNDRHVYADSLRFSDAIKSSVQEALGIGSGRLYAFCFLSTDSISLWNCQQMDRLIFVLLQMEKTLL